MKQNDYKKNTVCRYCNSANLVRFLSLGKHPPSNSFIKKEQIPQEKKYPLDVYLCQNCFLVQLLDVVSPEIIFDEYLYLSSSSKALKNHYGALAETLTKRFALHSGERVLDIGCNDGILLHGYQKKGLVKIGVEPSSVADIARKSGFAVLKEFFTKRTAFKIAKRYGKAKIVTITNVFAHVDNIKAFTEGLPAVLEDDGVIVIEAAYLVNLMDDVLFDTIYHEHLCYLSLTPMVPFFTQFGLEVFDAERVPFGASGPAIRVFVGKKGMHKILPSVKRFLSAEEKWGVRNPAHYKTYAKRVEVIKKTVLAMLTRLEAKGKRIGGYGAPAKGNTLLNYFGITSKMITNLAEVNELKQGLVTPGSHIPIVSEAQFIKELPDYALLLSWNYLNFFLEKSDYIKKGGKFIVPVPKPHIAP